MAWQHKERLGAVASPLGTSALDRGVAAATLLCFLATTLSPSLAWAADARDVAPSARVVDEVEASDVSAEKTVVEVAENPTSKPAGVRIPDALER